MTTPAEIPIELIHRLPKTDLHCHLDGSLRLDTVLELGKKQGNKLPTFDRTALHDMLFAGDHVTSLDDYLRAHEKVIQAEPVRTEVTPVGSDAMLFRMALSCLVDADHYDAARHGHEATPYQGPLLRNIRKEGILI